MLPGNPACLRGQLLIRAFPISWRESLVFLDFTAKLSMAREQKPTLNEFPLTQESLVGDWLELLTAPSTMVAMPSSSSMPSYRAKWVGHTTCIVATLWKSRVQLALPESSVPMKINKGSKTANVIDGILCEKRPDNRATCNKT